MACIISASLLCMAVQAETRKFKLGEFYKLGEVGILSEDEPVELLDGQIMIMAPIGENHRTVVDGLAEILTDQRKARYRVGVQNPLRIDDENEPQPDLVLYNRDVVARHPTPAETFLVVEVADASLSYDQQSKIPVYAAASIKEVWVIDLIRNRIHTYRDPAPANRTYAAFSSFDRLTWVSPSEFPDIRIRLAELL